MANIAISNLRPIGANLFQDSESFLHDLTDQEMIITLGGWVDVLWSSYCEHGKGGEATWSIVKWG